MAIDPFYTDEAERENAYRAQLRGQRPVAPLPAANEAAADVSRPAGRASTFSAGLMGGDEYIRTAFGDTIANALSPPRTERRDAGAFADGAAVGMLGSRSTGVASNRAGGPSTRPNGGARRKTAAAAEEPALTAEDQKRRSFGADVGGISDKERLARIKDLDSALGDLTSGKGLNMRSKRELYAQLLGQKNDLTSLGSRLAQERTLAQANIDADAAREGAAYAEQGASRRDDINRANAEFGLRRQLSQKSPLDLIEQQTRIRALDATAQREDDKYALQRAGERDKYSQGLVDDRAKVRAGGGPVTVDAQRAAYKDIAENNALTGRPLTTSPEVTGGAYALQDVAGQLNQKEDFFDYIASGGALGSGSLFQDEVGTGADGTPQLNPDDVETGKAGGLVPILDALGLEDKPYYAQLPGTSVRTRLTPEQYEQFKRDKNTAGLLRRNK